MIGVSIMPRIKKWEPSWFPLKPYPIESGFNVDMPRTPNLYFDELNITTATKKPGWQTAVNEIIQRKLLAQVPESQKETALNELKWYLHQCGPGEDASQLVSRELGKALWMVSSGSMMRAQYWTSNQQGELEVLSVVAGYKIVDIDGQEKKPPTGGEPFVACLVKTQLAFKENCFVRVGEPLAVLQCNDADVERILSKANEQQKGAITKLKTVKEKELAERLQFEIKKTFLEMHFHSREFQAIHNAVINGLEKYKYYLEMRYGLDEVSTGKALRYQKYNTICSMLKEAKREDIEVKDRLINAYQALHEHKALLSRHQTLEEKSIWAKIKSIFIKLGWWKSKGQKAVEGLERILGESIKGQGFFKSAKDTVEPGSKKPHP